MSTFELAPYVPSNWLPGGHTQTVFGRMVRQKYGIIFQRRRLDTPDGDFIDMDLPEVAGYLLPKDAPVVLLLHGLVEDPLYGSRGLLLLFLPAGLAAQWVEPGQIKLWHRLRRDWVWQWAAATLLLVIVLSLFSYRRHIQASWQANRAVVALAQLELADFPTGEWQTAAELPDYQPVIVRLQQATQLDPANRTANYHLGRLALLRQDFATAVSYLERAYKADPNHRGIRKALGYSYLWSGQLNKSFPLLATLAEVPGELDTYPWWWQSQNRDDLATLAQQMRDAVANNHSSSTP